MVLCFRAHLLSHRPALSETHKQMGSLGGLEPAGATCATGLSVASTYHNLHTVKALVQKPCSRDRVLQTSAFFVFWSSPWVYGRGYESWACLESMFMFLCQPCPFCRQKLVCTNACRSLYGLCGIRGIHPRGRQPTAVMGVTSSVRVLSSVVAAQSGFRACALSLANSHVWGEAR